MNKVNSNNRSYNNLELNIMYLINYIKYYCLEKPKIL